MRSVTQQKVPSQTRAEMCFEVLLLFFFKLLLFFSSYNYLASLFIHFYWQHFLLLVKRYASKLLWVFIFMFSSSACCRKYLLKKKELKYAEMRIEMLNSFIGQLHIHNRWWAWIRHRFHLLMCLCKLFAFSNYCEKPRGCSNSLFYDKRGGRQITGKKVDKEREREKEKMEIKNGEWENVGRWVVPLRR